VWRRSLYPRLSLGFCTMTARALQTLRSGRRIQLQSCMRVTRDARVQAKLQSCVIPTWTTGLAYWPFASVIMFRCRCPHFVKHSPFILALRQLPSQTAQPAQRSPADSCPLRTAPPRAPCSAPCGTCAPRAARPPHFPVTFCAFTCRIAPTATAARCRGQRATARRLTAALALACALLTFGPGL
jgi:hypothetical protein